MNLCHTSEASADAENVFSSDQISDTSLFHEICFETWYQGKKRGPQFTFHSTSESTDLQPYAPRAYTSAINASSSSMASDQFCLPALAVSASVQRLM